MNRSNDLLCLATSSTVTNFNDHPGGKSVLEDLAGQDATKAFEEQYHSDAAVKMKKKILRR